MRFAISGGELVAIVIFWAFLAALAVAGRLFDPRVPDLAPAVARGLALLSIFEYALWAVLTVPILWLTARLEFETARPVQRAWRVLLLVVIGIVIAIGVDSAVAKEHGRIVPQLRGQGRMGPAYRRGVDGVRPRLRRGPPAGMRGPFGPGTFPAHLPSFEIVDDFMVFLAIVGAGIARDYLRRYRARLQETARLEARAGQLEAQLAQAQLGALRSQLNPHFLFNTLNAVAALVERDPKGVRRMLARLGELLRHTLESSGQPEIPLEREVELLRRYVDIMETRFQGSLQVSIDVSADLFPALVPNLMLQPLVENAMKHGVARADENGRITVSAHREGDDLVLRVIDNGPGPSQGGENREQPGVGLANTRDRLQRLYGDRQSLDLRAAEGGGAVAEVRLPWHLQPATA